MLVGIISDTHDLLRPEALAALAGAEYIVHCGDVCRPEILETLREVAPLSVVRGNCDHGDWAQEIPIRDTFELADARIHAIHDLHDLDLDPPTAGISLVLSGHTHCPHVERRQGVLYVNPGSAGPRRARLPVALALLRIAGSELSIEPRDLG